MDEYQEAREIALHFLDYQPRTSAEVLRRLGRAGTSEDVAEAVVADLQRAGLLDDQRFSEAWVADRARRKGYGRARLADELRVRGVDRSIVEAALAGVDTDAELASAIALARKRLGVEGLGDPAVRRRLVAHLRRRGFDWDVIEGALGTIEASDGG